MDRILVLLIAFLFVALPVKASPQFWTPSPADVQKLEAAIGPVVNFGGYNCPPQKITGFARYYAGLTDKRGHRIIVGQFFVVKDFPDRGAGVHIQPTPSGVTDGGCGIADVWFDADTLKLTQAVWGVR
jgi:hypothetical protein